MKAKTVSLVLFFMSAPGMAPALEQDEHHNAVQLSEVVVTAARIAEPFRDVTANVTLINADEIAASPARDIGELLAEKGVGYIRKYPGQLTSIGIRGFKTDTHGNDLKAHVLILLNGRRSGTGNLSKLLTKNVERVEIIRGPGAVQYGSAAMGGVVNIITRQGKGDLSAEAHGTLGNFNYDEVGLLINTAQSNFDLSSSFSRSTMDDYDTGSGDKFKNSGYDHIDHYSLNAGYTFHDSQRISLIFNRYYADEIGSPGYFSANDLDDYTNSSNHSIDLIYDGSAALYTWQVRYFTGNDRDTWHDPVVSNPDFWDDDTPSQRDTDQYGTQAQISMDINSVRLTTGMDWLKYEVDASWDPKETEYENCAVFFLAKAKFMDSKLIVDGGLRYDSFDVEVNKPAGNDEDDTNVSTSFGLAYLLTNELKIRAHYGEAFVMPGADEMAADYSIWGTYYIGNPDLDPESSRTYEGAVDYTGSSLKASLGYFYTRFKDKIENVVSSDFSSSTWDNIGKAEISGIEGTFSWDLGSLFNWKHEVRPYVSFVYLDTYEDLDTNKDLKYTNEWNASYGVSINDYEGFSARLNFSYTGPQTVDDWESGYPPPEYDMGGYTIADLAISKKILDFDRYGSCTLSGEATNLFDKDFAYVKGYPMPGRSLLVTLTYNY